MATKKKPNEIVALARIAESEGGGEGPYFGDFDGSVVLSHVFTSGLATGGVRGKEREAAALTEAGRAKLMGSREFNLVQSALERNGESVSLRKVANIVASNRPLSDFAPPPGAAASALAEAAREAREHPSLSPEQIAQMVEDHGEQRRGNPAHVPVADSKKGDIVTFQYRGFQVTGIVMRVLRSGTRTVKVTEASEGFERRMAQAISEDIMVDVEPRRDNPIYFKSVQIFHDQEKKHARIVYDNGEGTPAVAVEGDPADPKIRALLRDAGDIQFLPMHAMRGHAPTADMVLVTTYDVDGAKVISTKEIPHGQIAHGSDEEFLLRVARETPHGAIVAVDDGHLYKKRVRVVRHGGKVGYEPVESGRKGNPADPNDETHAERMQATLQEAIGDRQVYVRPPNGSSLSFITFVNLPHGIGREGGGAEAENNKMRFNLESKSRSAPYLGGDMTVSESTSFLPREDKQHRLRKKTGGQAVITRYLADFLRKVVADVPPNFTHTKRESNPARARLLPSTEKFIDAYIEAALWSSRDNANDQGGEPLDKNYSASDIDGESLRQMERDCQTFLDANDEDIGTSYEQAGHDFWLTRNGHGAGFWDGDWPEPAATRLTEASKKFGEQDLYVGDDKKLHVSPAPIKRSNPAKSSKKPAKKIRSVTTTEMKKVTVTKTEKPRKGNPSPKKTISKELHERLLEWVKTSQGKTFKYYGDVYKLTKAKKPTAAQVQAALKELRELQAKNKKPSTLHNASDQKHLATTIRELAAVKP